MRLPLLTLLGFVALIGCREVPAAGMKTSAAGHAFAFLPMADAADVSIQLAWPMPWPMQDGRNPAVPYIATELMLGGGAAGKPPAEIQESFNDLNANGFLYVAGPSLRGGLTVPRDRLDLALVTANAVLASPNLPQDWMERIRDGMAADQAEANLQPAAQGWQALRNVVLGDQPYNEFLSLQNTEAMRAVTLDEVQQWRRETVVTGGISIAVAGALTEAEAGQAVDALLAGLPGETAPAAAPKPFNFAARSILLHVPDAQKTILGIVGRVPPSGDDGEFVEVLVSLLLAGDDQSLLFDALRTDLRASYGFSAGIDGYTRRDRILVISGEVETAQTAAARDVVVKTYASLFDKAVPSDMFDRWKLAIQTQMAPGKADPFARTSAMLESMLDGAAPQRVLELDAMLERTTPETLMARLRSGYTPAAELMVMAVSPDANALPGACVITRLADAVTCP